METVSPRKHNSPTFLLRAELEPKLLQPQALLRTESSQLSGAHTHRALVYTEMGRENVIAFSCLKTSAFLSNFRNLPKIHYPENTFPARYVSGDKGPLSGAPVELWGDRVLVCQGGALTPWGPSIILGAAGRDCHHAPCGPPVTKQKLKLA